MIYLCMLDNLNAHLLVIRLQDTGSNTINEHIQYYFRLCTQDQHSYPEEIIDIFLTICL